MRFPMPVWLVLVVVLNGPATAADTVADSATDRGKFARAVNIRSTPLRVKALDAYRGRPLTVEFWTKLAEEKKARYNVLLSHLPEKSPAHWEIHTTPLDGLLTVRLGGPQPTLVPTFVRITDGQWHFVAVTLEADRVTVAIDGRQVARQKVSERSDSQTEGELFVGTEFVRDFASQQPGFVDELRLSNVVRDLAKVPMQTLEVDKHTVALWRFDEEAGNTHRDESPLGNSLAYSPGVESAWTPRSSTRPDAPEWEKATDDDWHDDRFSRMDTGGLLGCSMSAAASMGNKTGPYAGKGLAIRLGHADDPHTAAVLFDRGRLQLAAGWTGDFLTIPDRRFSLIEHPRAAGEMLFSLPSAPGFANPEALSATAPEGYGPLPQQWGRYLGLYLCGGRKILSYTAGGTAVLDMPGNEELRGRTVITRTLEIPGDSRLIQFSLLHAPQMSVSGNMAFYKDGEDFIGVLAQRDDRCPVVAGPRSAFLRVEPRKETVVVKLVYFRAPRAVAYQMLKDVQTAPPPEPPSRLISASKKAEGLPSLSSSRKTLPNGRGSVVITTRGQLGKENGKNPFVVDTLTLPQDNPYGSIFYVTGVGFLPDGRLAIGTIYGDVWLVDGVDEKLEQLRWTRFASGLYQPNGLVIQNGRILVLERGQVTRLHDLDGDDSADFYECYYNGWQTPGDGHAYDTALKLAPDGALFFFKGQTSRPDKCPESGCLVRIAPDGASHEVYATGFRHPIGLGMSPNGVVTGADQQGNWMPATRIDRYTRGGFYGDMRTHHRATPPKIYDPPLCWLPRDVDNSAGGQVWVPPNTWGPLAGKPLHLSWGRCRLLHLLPENVGGQWQGGVVPLPCETLLSGPITGGFRPEDGHLYVVGLNGWQTAAREDGCLQRIRRTGEPLNLPVGLHAQSDGMQLRFSDPLDPAAATDVANYTVQRWGYRWSAAYGSDHWSIADPDRQGHDSVPVESVTLSEDGLTVTLHIADMQPVMQMKLAYRLKAADGTPVESAVHHTVHRLPPSDKTEPRP